MDDELENVKRQNKALRHSLARHMVLSVVTAVALAFSVGLLLASGAE